MNPTSRCSSDVGAATTFRMLGPAVVMIALFGVLPASAQTKYYYRYYSRAEDSLLNVSVRLIDAGEIGKARELLQRAEKEYPANSSFPYELAYILYAQEEYAAARDRLLKLIDAPDVTDRIYQLLGNTHDILGNPTEAIRIYEKGLKLFPESGSLYLERGVMALNSKDIPGAMEFWEEGIARDPAFSSNYFHAGRYWMQSINPGWGLIYGELFLNLEPVSRRADMMREGLMATWNQAISMNNYKDGKRKKQDSNQFSLGGLELFRQINVVVDSTATIRFPFEMFYGKAMSLASIGFLLQQKPTMTIADLHDIRSRFVDAWFDDTLASGHFAIDLFDRLRQLKKADLLEAYDFMMFRTSATEEEARTWREKNSGKMSELATWLDEHRMSADPDVAFSRLKLEGLVLSKEKLESE